MSKNSNRKRWRHRFILLRDRLECLYCGGTAETVDHYIPTAMDGPDAQSNMFACCKSCNQLKADMHPGTFISSNGFSTNTINNRMKDRLGKPRISRETWNSAIGMKQLGKSMLEVVRAELK